MSTNEVPIIQNDHLRISNLVFSSGNRTNNQNLDVECGNVVILVGPNNSGKSTALKEIEDYCLGGKKQLTVLSDVKFNTPLTENGIGELINTYRIIDPPKGQNIPVGTYLLSIPDVKGQGEAPQYQSIDPVAIEQFLKLENIPRDKMNKQIIKFFTIFLDGATRFDLIKNKPRGDLKIHPANPLATIFRDQEIHGNIDTIIHNEFNWHFYLDSTGPNGQLEISFNKEEFSNWKSQDKSAIEFFSKFTSIKNVGDGIKTFTGLLVAGMSLPHKIFVVDEPEAFLHPPKARALGSHLTRLIEKREASLIISTHSPEFVLGCLDESKKVTIIRLTYDGSNGTTKHLELEQVSQFTTDPLLRTTETINALFHDSAIVSEYHPDRVFYNEIHNRYKADESSVTNDTLFLNTNGKDVIHRIFGPLRKIGIPAAAIYDLDIVEHKKLKNKDISQWENILQWANVPSSEIADLESSRATLEKDLNDSKTDQSNPYHLGGLEILETDKKNNGEELLSKLKKYGIFIVPSGTLESWSVDLFNESYDKSHWLEIVLEKLSSEEITLSEKKIWIFIKDVNTWLTNPNREGMISESENSSQ